MHHHSSPLRTLLLTVALFATGSSLLAAPVDQTVLFEDRAVTVRAEATSEPPELWIDATDLARVNDFVLKPEGACLDELCIPVAREGEDAIVREANDRTQFSLTRFADHIGQEYVVDAEAGVWSFGEIPAARSAFFDLALAPDFELPDKNGDLFRLSELRGKKVLIMTWASW